MIIKKIHEEFSVCQVEDYSKVDLEAEYVFTGRTARDVPSNVINREDGWKGFRIEGVLDFSLIGILSQISGILADNGIPIYAMSTYNSDYILIKGNEDYEKALKALSDQGYEIMD